MMTPFDKLASLPNVAQYLKPGMTLKALRAQAHALSDSAAARQLNQAKATLFARSFNSRKSA
jgi:hypothetical protein